MTEPLSEANVAKLRQATFVVGAAWDQLSVIMPAMLNGLRDINEVLAGDDTIYRLCAFPEPTEPGLNQPLED